ncbi:hypothetical protein [Exiguobacterium artemiae]|uniref:hypothetical protein n=1 Tax=Exiguobacterium artemiae TaxID=340145 RepID=UPI0006868B4D|nr:hypothetical protein [Exiguobacterium sibiricum]
MMYQESDKGEEQNFRQADIIYWEPFYKKEWLILDETHWEISWSESGGDQASRGSNAYLEGWEFLWKLLYSQFKTRK